MRRALVALALLLAGCHHADAPAPPDPAAQRAYDEMKARFDAAAQRDPTLAAALRDRSDVVVATRPALVQDLVQEAARRYLDRVTLDLTPRVRFDEERDVQVGTFLGKMTAGQWRVQGGLRRVGGVLSAGTPQVTTAADNSLAVRLPVTVREGRVSANVRFTWDGKSVAGAVCRDFEVARELEGVVLPETFTVTGRFQLSAGRDAMRLDPEFPPHPFRLRVDLTPASWAVVGAALDEQNTLLRCGIGLHREEILGKLRDRLHEGFDVRLPQSLFRPIDFPTGVRHSVAVQDHTLDLQVQTHALVVTPEAIWYSADVRSALRLGSPAAPAPPSPSPPAR